MSWRRSALTSGYREGVEHELATEQTTAALWRLGRYTLRERIGAGGMGVVHRGLDAEGNVVAIKLLRPNVAADEDSRVRFAREVRILSRVRGHHIAEVLDADVAAETPYLVTRYIDGEPLEEAVTTDGPLRGAALESLAADLVEALESIHAAGIVHRDLKPANVLVSAGEAVVIDFGIAQLADETRLTVPGMVFGTPGYLAPEVLGGGDVSMAADVYAWATTVAYAATGRPPFGRGRFEAVSYAVVHKEPDLDGVPGWLEPVLRGALAKDPRQRPNVAELRSWADTVDTQAGGAAQAPVGTVPVGTDAEERPFDWATDAADDWAPGAVGQGAADGTGEGSGEGDHDGVGEEEQVGATAVLPVVPPARQAPDVVGPGDPDPVDDDVDATRGVDDDVTGTHAAGAERGEEDADRFGVSVDDLIAARPRSRHRVVTLLLFAVLAGMGAVVPVPAAIALVTWLVVARTVDRSATFVETRRAERGRRGLDVVAAFGALPWHLIHAVAATALTLVVGGVGIVVLVGFVALFAYASGISVPLTAVYAGTALLLGIFANWGFLSEPVRHGSHRILDRVVGPPEFAAASGLVLTVGAGALVVLAILGTISYWPAEMFGADHGAATEVWRSLTSASS